MKHIATLLMGLAVFAQSTLALAPTDPTEDPFRSGLAALRAARFEDAYALFTEAVKVQPDNAKAWYYRGVTLQNMGEAEAALHDVDRSLALDHADADAHLTRAEILIVSAYYQEARQELENLLRMRTTEPVAVNALFSLGVACSMQDDDAAALQAYDRLIALAPTDARAWCDRGITRSRMGDQQGAIEDLTEAIRLDPRQVNAYAARSYAHGRAGQRSEACGDALRARALGDPEMGGQVLSYCDQ